MIETNSGKYIWNIFENEIKYAIVITNINVNNILFIIHI